MNLRLYDTYSRTLRDFTPLVAGEVGLYTCGPTVYDYAHIGNLRTYLFEDILRRVLEFNHYHVRHVMNITDVGHLVSDGDEGEDKMEKGARRTVGEGVGRVCTCVCVRVCRGWGRGSGGWSPQISGQLGDGEVGVEWSSSSVRTT